MRTACHKRDVHFDATHARILRVQDCLDEIFHARQTDVKPAVCDYAVPVEGGVVHVVFLMWLSSCRQGLWLVNTMHGDHAVPCPAMIGLFGEWQFIV